MAVTLVNVGSVPNDKTGDQLRKAFQTVNQNTSALNSRLESVETDLPGIELKADQADARSQAAAPYHATVTWAENLTINVQQANHLSCTLAGATNITFSGMGLMKNTKLRLVNPSGTGLSVNFTQSLTWLMPELIEVAAGATVILSLVCYGTNPSDIVVESMSPAYVQVYGGADSPVDTVPATGPAVYVRTDGVVYFKPAGTTGTEGWI